MDSMSSVSPAVPKAILQHLQVGIVVVFRPYEAKLISIHCVRPAILVRSAVPKWYGHQEDC